MTRQRRLLLASLSAAWVGMVLACGGAGSGERSRGTAVGQGEQKKADEQIGQVEEKGDQIDPVEQRKADELLRQEARKKYEDALEKYKGALAARAKEVERIKAENARRKEEHEKALDEWRERSKEFQKAEDEYKAAPELAQALDLYRDSRTRASRGETREAERLMEAVRRRCRNIMDSYPATQAARDAERLSNGQSVAARPFPGRPVSPDRPSGPYLLPIPSPPEKPVYVDPVQVRAEAAAEEKRKRQDAARKAEEAHRAEAARRAEEEYDADGLVLLNKTVKGKRGEFGGEITGTVVNRRGHTLSYAQITFNLYDESGAQVGTALANINGLEPGGRWNFTATTFGKDFSRFKFSELTGF